MALLVPVVVGLEGARLVEAHVLGLLVGELGEVRLEGGEVERGDELVHQLGHQVDVRLVPPGGRVEQLCRESNIMQSCANTNISHHQTVNERNIFLARGLCWVS